MKNHISTLTLIFYPDHAVYGYEYDDINGNIQSESGYPTIGEALGDAFKRIKTFLVLPDVETK